MPLVGFLLFELALIATNYTPGTWLAGWDNLMPELYFEANFLRSVSGIWQQVRGLGLVDGMSHIANLPHTLFLWLLSFILPAQILRYAFTFLMHALGAMGMYLLLGRLGLPATVGSLFYATNLATIQMFFTPLEAFSIHFAAIPWLAWALLRYSQLRTRRSLGLFFIIALLSSPQFFVPTLLLPISGLMATLSLWRRHLVKAVVGFFIIQAFWLLPWLATIRQNAPVITDAKINIMSSQEAYLRNVVFGNPLAVLTHQGFPLNFEDTNERGEFYLPMNAWNEQRDSRAGIAGRIGIAALGIWGLFISLKRRKKELYPFVSLFALAFLFLANDTPLIREASDFIRNAIPAAAESMRFPFTKWATLFAATMSIFISYALTRARREIIVLTILVVGFLFLPAFQGNFIYKNLRIAIPQEYFSLFAFMKTAPQGRIALLPQPDYWSWKHYRFGYRGSGFLWYGFKQPLMDRAFDPWSRGNENYYWQLSRALYQKDPVALANVFRKYDIDYILVDGNLISPNHNRALFTEEIETILPQLSEFTLRESFGNLKLYARIITDKNDFITVKRSLPYAGPASAWSEEDISYAELGDYITGERGLQYASSLLFTKRQPLTHLPFSLAESDLVFDTSSNGVLNEQAVKTCGVLKLGSNNSLKNEEGLVLTSTNQRACVGFSLGALPHAEGYIVAVDSVHIAGRPLLISFINQTARHTETEVYLPSSTSPTRSYISLPPLAEDGLGYDVYIANDALGTASTINQINRIQVYRIPYSTLLSAKTSFPEISQGETLILSQAYDPGWKAFRKTGTFPFVELLTGHVLINNWANGWTTSDNSGVDTQQVQVFFVPQIWQFVGFALLPLPFLLLLTRKRRAA